MGLGDMYYFPQVFSVDTLVQRQAAKTVMLSWKFIPEVDRIPVARATYSAGSLCEILQSAELDLFDLKDRIPRH